MGSINLTDQQRRALHDRGTLLVLTVADPKPPPGARLLGHSATGYVWSTMEHANPCEPECVFEVECPHYPGQALRIEGTDDTAEVVEARAPMRMLEMSGNAAFAAGVRSLPLQEDEPGCWWTADVSAGPGLQGRTPEGAYFLAWNATHPDPAHKWEANPWVWVTVVRLKGNKDA